MGVRGQFLKKTEVLEAELNERAEAATCVYSSTDNFLQCIYSVLMDKNHQKFRSRCLVHEFFLQRYFSMILTIN